MPLHLVTQPTEEPITLEEAKLHLRVDGDEEDSYIAGLITSAREHAESFQRRAYNRRTYELTLHAWPRRREIRLPMPPLVSVESVVYETADGQTHTLPTEAYRVDAQSAPGRIVLRQGHSWPGEQLAEANAITISYTAGYDDLPLKLRQAMLLIIGHWYLNRETVVIGRAGATEVPFAAKALLWPDRVWGGDYE